jgi:hypothetical protein
MTTIAFALSISSQSIKRPLLLACHVSSRACAFTCVHYPIIASLTSLPPSLPPSRARNAIILRNAPRRGKCRTLGPEVTTAIRSCGQSSACVLPLPPPPPHRPPFSRSRVAQFSHHHPIRPHRSIDRLVPRGLDNRRTSLARLPTAARDHLKWSWIDAARCSDSITVRFIINQLLSRRRSVFVNVYALPSCTLECRRMRYKSNLPCRQPDRHD